MFGLINPLYKIAAIVGLVAVLFAFGYYKGYSSEKARFDAFKAEIEAATLAQEKVNQQIIKRQDIVTKGITNEYKAKIARLESVYNGVQYRDSTAVSSNPSTASRVNEKTQNIVLDCAVTTQQLVSLQDWIEEQRKQEK
jgi:hypothetical protein